MRLSSGQRSPDGIVQRMPGHEETLTLGAVVTPSDSGGQIQSADLAYLALVAERLAVSACHIWLTDPWRDIV